MKFELILGNNGWLAVRKVGSDWIPRGATGFCLVASGLSRSQARRAHGLALADGRLHFDMDTIAWLRDVIVPQALGE